MNRSAKIWIGVGVLGVTLFVALWWLRREETHSSSAAADHPLSTSTKSEEARPQESVNEHEITKDNPMPRAPGLSDQAWNYISRLYTASIAENNPMQFHGRLLDQNGEPVAGAVITTVHSWFDESWIRRAYPKPPLGNESGGVPVLEETNQITTASDGSFHLVKGQATSLYIRSLEKDGCLWDQASGGAPFTYSARFIGRDSAKWPNYTKANGDFVIRVWKSGQTETLIGVNCSVPVEPFGTNWYAVNLVTGKTEDFEKADLLFWFETLKDSDGNPLRRFRIKLSHGGVALNNDLYSHLAPESGYTPALDWNYEPYGKHKNQDSETFLKKRLYVKARNGKVYGTIMWHWSLADRVLISGYINPAGSRNLEPDPEKLIADPGEIERLNEETRVNK